MGAEGLGVSLQKWRREARGERHRVLDVKRASSVEPGGTTSFCFLWNDLTVIHQSLDTAMQTVLIVTHGLFSCRTLALFFFPHIRLMY